MVSTTLFSLAYSLNPAESQFFLLATSQHAAIQILIQVWLPVQWQEHYLVTYTSVEQECIDVNIFTFVWYFQVFFLFH